MNDVQCVYAFRQSCLSSLGEGKADSTLYRPSEARIESITSEASRLEPVGAGAGAGPPTAPPKETLETILLALDAEK